MPCDASVVEFYPFGRRRFKNEIVSLFNAVREVLAARATDNARRMVASVRKPIHTVFVRGAPQLIRLQCARAAIVPPERSRAAGHAQGAASHDEATHPLTRLAAAQREGGDAHGLAAIHGVADAIEELVAQADLAPALARPA